MFHPSSMHAASYYYIFAMIFAFASLNSSPVRIPASRSPASFASSSAALGAAGGVAAGAAAICFRGAAAVAAVASACACAASRSASSSAATATSVAPSSPDRSYAARFLGSLSTSYASLMRLKRSASPPRSGCSFNRASFQAARTAEGGASGSKPITPYSSVCNAPPSVSRRCPRSPLCSRTAAALSNVYSAGASGAIGCDGGISSISDHS